MWRSLNFEHSGFFESKFKRKPKNWTVSDIHKIWLKLKDRSSKRRKEFLDYLHWVIENIPPNDGKKWMIFYSDKSFYLLEKMNGHSEVSYGIRHVDNKRNSKIDSIILHSSTIEIGKKLKSLENMTSHLDWKVKSHLDRLIGSKMPKKTGMYGDEDKFIRINDIIYLYKFTIRTNESKIITEVKEDKIIDL